jgi:hypothetical protein
MRHLFLFFPSMRVITMLAPLQQHAAQRHGFPLAHLQPERAPDRYSSVTKCVSHWAARRWPVRSAVSCHTKLSAMLLQSAGELRQQEYAHTPDLGF